MSIRNLVSTLALAACTLAPITSHAASIFGHGAASGASVTNPALKSKMIKFTLSNKTSAPMNLLINEQPVTLAANSQMPIKAAEGQRQSSPKITPP